jgi:putative redox protein
MSKEISVRLGNINYACIVSDGRHEWMLDEPVDNGGSDIAHDPYSALLASIGSCSAITMKMYAQRKGWQVEDIEIKMSLATQTIAGKKHSVFTRSVYVKGNLDNDQLMRLKQIVTVCPVSKILEGEIKVETILAHVPDEYSVDINDIKEST